MDPDSELEASIYFLNDPIGDESHGARSHRALEYLLANADVAHPRLLQDLEMRPAETQLGVIEALPLFGRAESIGVLERMLLEGSDIVSWTAGQALGAHPLSAARETLMHALSSPRRETTIGALAGLTRRNDRSACDAIRLLLGDRDALIRYHALQAGGRLSCLKNQDLAALASGDPDPKVRELAVRVLGVIS
jgi:HEAT repeat protein